MCSVSAACGAACVGTGSSLLPLQMMIWTSSSSSLANLRTTTVYICNDFSNISATAHQLKRQSCCRSCFGTAARDTTLSCTCLVSPLPADVCVVNTSQVHIRWGAGLPPPQLPEDDGDDPEQQPDQDSKRQRRKEQEKKKEKAAKELSPYCTVAAGPSAAVSRPVNKSRDAQWRETFFLYIRCGPR